MYPVILLDQLPNPEPFVCNVPVKVVSYPVSTVPEVTLRFPLFETVPEILPKSVEPEITPELDTTNSAVP